MIISINILFILTSIALSILIFVGSCMLFMYSKKSLNECRELVKKTALFDEQLSMSSNYKAVSKQKQQELDDTLGIINIKTKISKDLYIETIARVMTEFDFVEQAAIRYIIGVYQASQWISVNVATPEIGFHVWGYCQETEDYLCVTFTSDHEWFIVEHDNNLITMPSALVLTHWKPFDQIT